MMVDKYDVQSSQGVCDIDAIKWVFYSYPYITSVNVWC